MSRAIDADAVLEYEKFYVNMQTGTVNRAVTSCVIRGAPTLSLNTLRDEVYADAVAHGLYEGEYDVPELERAAPGLMFRIQEEVKEAWTAALDWMKGIAGAKEHVAEELADIIITALSVAGHLGIDIDAALHRKMEINKKRPYKHKEK